MDFTQLEADAEIIRNSHDLEALDQALDRVIGYCSLITFGITSGSLYYRARKINSGDRLKAASDLSYPPKQFAGPQRLSDPQVPNLYAALREETSLSEIGACNGDLVQLTAFAIKPGRELRLTSLGQFTGCYKNGHLPMIGPDPGHTIARLLNQRKPLDRQMLVFADSLLSEVLASPEARENDYLKTRLLVAKIYGKNVCSGMLYPSVRNAGAANIAITAAACDQVMQPISSRVIEVNARRDFSLYEFTVLRHVVGINAEGLLVYDEGGSRYEPRSFGVTEEELKVMFAE